MCCTRFRYSLYFGVYGALQTYCGGGDSGTTSLLGPTGTAALYGAIAGCACWLPIYPIDVIRTMALNTDGSKTSKMGDNEYDDDNNDDDDAHNPWQIAVHLYQTAGWQAFYDGLGARLLRQAVNHAVTFSVYEGLMSAAETLGV